MRSYKVNIDFLKSLIPKPREVHFAIVVYAVRVEAILHNPPPTL